MSERSKFGDALKVTHFTKALLESSGRDGVQYREVKDLDDTFVSLIKRDLEEYFDADPLLSDDELLEVIQLTFKTLYSGSGIEYMSYRLAQKFSRENV